MRTKKYEDYGNTVQRLYGRDRRECGSICRNITFQITNACNLRCSYCYEHHKSTEKMTLETGKKIVDYLLVLYEKNDSDFINQNTRAVVLDFIGGEPLLEASLIEKICDYWFAECWRRKIPLAPFTRISFATNGQLWFTPAAQRLLEKYHDLMSVTVSIDGVQELHDRYRIDPDGHGSFATAWAAFQDGKRRFGWLNSKMTFVPGSIQYIAESMKMMLDAGCRHIAGNCAYEPVYTAEDANGLYKQLKEVSRYVIENKWDVAIGMLDEQVGGGEKNDRNYCGGTGAMLAFAPDGSAYPCIRYAPISVGKEKADKVCLGNVTEGGLYATEQQRKVKEELDAITMKSQSTRECIECPVSSGCGWCSGLNYDLYGTANKRCTNICMAHKARVLAVCWYCNARSLAMGDMEPKKVNLPYEEVERLIGADEAAELKAIEKEAAEKWAW